MSILDPIHWYLCQADLILKTAVDWWLIKANPPAKKTISDSILISDMRLGVLGNRFFIYCTSFG